MTTPFQKLCGLKDIVFKLNEMFQRHDYLYITPEYYDSIFETAQLSMGLEVQPFEGRKFGFWDGISCDVETGEKLGPNIIEMLKMQELED